MLGGLLAAAGLTPTGALLAGGVAAALAGPRNIAGALALWSVASAPWLVAAILSGTGGEPSDPVAVAAFAARAEPGLGTLGSLAGLGGIWNRDAVPSSRTTVLALIATAVLLAMVATGVRTMLTGDQETRHSKRLLLALAAGAIVGPTLGATGWGLHLGEQVVAQVPGAGLLRDTQKYVALAMPAYALCAAAGSRAVGEFVRRRSRSDRSTARSDRSTASVAAAAFIAMSLVMLPDLAWGVGGALRPVHYPPSWQRVAALVRGPGDIAVLPGGMFRVFPYSGQVPVLDPAPRMLPGDVLQTGDLPVHGRIVAGEGTRARAVEQLLHRGGAAGDLARHGVGWVVVEHDTPGPLGESKTTLSQLVPIYADPNLALYQVPGAIDRHAEATATHRRIAVAAHLMWTALLVSGLLAAGASTISRCRGATASMAG
jgi:hypothetical protein